MLYTGAGAANTLKTLWAFLKRDIAIERTYRASFLFQLGEVFFTIIFFVILSWLVGDSSAPYLRSYGGTYLSFVFLGIAFNIFMFNGLTSFGNQLRESQLAGTLQAVLMTPVPLSVFVLSSGLWGHVRTLLRALAYVIAGMIMGMDLSNANLPGAILTLFLGILAFDALGIMGSAMVMLTKRVLPFMVYFSTASALLSGVFFPLQILPSQIKWLSALLPSTYALEGLRLALLRGVSTSALLPQLVPLALFDALLLPLAFWIFYLSTQRVMMNGSLFHY